MSNTKSQWFIFRDFDYISPIIELNLFKQQISNYKFHLN